MKIASKYEHLKTLSTENLKIALNQRHAMHPAVVEAYENVLRQRGELAEKSQCQNCDAIWADAELKPVRDLEQRVAPGEPMPSGECPECGAVCHPIRETGNRLTINSRAALLRALPQLGLQIRVTEHWHQQLVGTVRTPQRTQTNGYFFYGLNHEGKRVRMWAEVPPARELRFNDDGTVTFHPDTAKAWTLSFELPEVRQ